MRGRRRAGHCPGAARHAGGPRGLGRVGRRGSRVLREVGHLRAHDIVAELSDEPKPFKLSSERRAESRRNFDAQQKARMAAAEEAKRQREAEERRIADEKEKVCSVQEGWVGELAGHTALVGGGIVRQCGGMGARCQAHSIWLFCFGLILVL